jgi:hypothetical protein
MDFSTLQTGRRYLFYFSNNASKEHKNKNFRADFLDIINKTLRVTKYQKDEYGFHMSGMVTMPLDWIEKVESLDNITLNQMIIPSEICIEIDGFV